MGKAWPHRLRVRGIWPRDPAPTFEELPALFSDPELGPTRHKWFLSFVLPAGDCEEWMGGRTTAGPARLDYGHVSIGGRSFSAHRVAWIVLHGESPGDLCVCHRCDNPPCVKKAHLFLGTVSDNERDKIRKGRHNPPRGERSPQARLTEELVREMRGLHQIGWGVKMIARYFELPRMTVKYAVLGVTWAHVEGVVQPPEDLLPLPRNMPQGSSHPNSKLSEDDVREIRRLSSEGWGHRRLADRFKVNRSTIRVVVSREAWAHVE